MVDSSPHPNGQPTGSPHDNPFWLEALLFGGAIVLAYLLGWRVRKLKNENNNRGESYISILVYALRTY